MAKRNGSKAEEIRLDRFEPELVDITFPKEHSENYRQHPREQLEEIAASIRANGFYRAIVLAEDGTILAGHGVFEAVRDILQLDQIPALVLPLAPDSTQALKILTGDNELPRFAITDDRALSLLLKRINDEDPSGLVGTGYDDKAVAALVLVTRMAAEIADHDEAAEWVGMPDFDGAVPPEKLVVSFRTPEDRDRFVEQFDITITYRGKTMTAWWPHRERRDLASMKFEG